MTTIPPHRQGIYILFAPHKVFSRIDFFFGSQDILHLVEEICINEMVISDHAPITIDIGDTTLCPKYRSWCFPSYLATQTIFQTFLQRELNIYSELNHIHTPDLTLSWEAGKAYIRGYIIAYVLSCKKEKSKQFMLAGARVREAQNRYQTNRGDQCREEWIQAKKLFDTSQELF